MSPRRRDHTSTAAVTLLATTTITVSSDSLHRQWNILSFDQPLNVFILTLVMLSSSLSLRAILAVILFIGHQQSANVSAFAASTAIPSRLNGQAHKSVLSKRGNLMMSSDVAVLPEAPKANLVETIPDKVTKEFSSSRVSSINLLKNCLGAGVFSLNARVSAISTNPATILPAGLLVLTMALWATYNFYMVSARYEFTVWIR